MLDCLIIGGGPAGLTSAIYLGRYLRKVMVIDKGDSRASLIPATHNYPGFEKGKSGRDFLDALRTQAATYGADLQQGEVRSLRKTDAGHFVAASSAGELETRTIILATGITDAKPDLPGIRDFIYDGVIRFCPICDGYEAKDKRVAIVGPCEKIYKKAIFLSTYTDQVVLCPLDKISQCDPEDLERMRMAGITPPSATVSALHMEAGCAHITFSDGQQVTVDVLYPAMGATAKTAIAKDLGITGTDGFIATDAHQQTAVPGLYAAGDITLDLSQIAVATGQAAIAATAVHNSLPLNVRHKS